MTTTDPVTLLQDKSVERRAEATRYYERSGDLDDIDLLLGYAQNDSSIAKIYILHNNVKKGAIWPISKYLPWKTTQKLLLDCKNLSTTSEVMKMSSSEVTVMSTIDFALSL